MKTLSNHPSHQRGSRRKLKKSAIFGAAVAFLLFFAGMGQIAHAASVITVTTTDDELNADGDCSLREAIQAANADTAVDACLAGSGADTIVVPPGTYLLSIAGADEDANATGDLDIASDVTIIGAGSAATVIDGDDVDRVLHIVSGVTELSGSTIQGGGGGVCHGAGIYNEGGTLTLNESTVSGNTGGAGGGVNNNPGRMMAINNSIISGNTAAKRGGGIDNSGTLILSGSTVSDNGGGVSGSASDPPCPGLGFFGAGGIFNNATLTVIDSTISGNTAPIPGFFIGLSGGGIMNYGGNVTLNSTTVSGNFANDRGGGIVNFITGWITIDNSTISSNSATQNGGAIFSFDGMVTIRNSTVSGNGSQNGTGGIRNEAGSTLNLLSSILANSTSGGDCSGSTITSQGYNLIEDSSSCTIIGDMTGNLMGVDPVLGLLADNGGPTQTHALLPGSPAINAGSPGCPPPASDQRGIARPQGATCDMGAYELEQTPADTTDPTIVITTPANGATYLLGQVVLADYTCEDEAGGSGVASCVGTVPNGSAIDTASVGAKTFAVDAADNAGNTNSDSVSYNVIYSFDGFFAPVVNPPTLNAAKAGQTIALKWRITDASGLPVTDLTSATVAAVSLACELGATTDQMEEYASGTSGLQNLGDGYYQFNWKTPKSYANSCKTLKLNLGEGMVHEALFKFTK